MPRRSRNPYPPNWPEIANATKAATNWVCVRCEHPHDPASGYTLTVHHLDIDPSNCEWWNLAALCQRCHLHIQAKVIMERTWYLPHSQWFRPFVAGYYAAAFGLPHDQDSVMKNLDALIELGQGKITLSQFTQNAVTHQAETPPGK